MESEKNKLSMFEYETACTMEVYKEFSDAAAGVKKLRKAVWIFVIVITAILVCSVFIEIDTYGSIRDAYVWFQLFVLSGFGVFLILIVYVLIPSKIKSMYKTNCEKNGVNWREQMYFFDDYVFVSLENSNEKYAYAQFGKLIETENLLILMIGKSKGILKIGLCVTKTGVTKGDYESLKQFICKQTNLLVKVR